jgi:tRNA dimethylallyltransferase
MARVWLIAGPTASGKSALALRLAERTGAEIVNADSMQLYADLRVLTARPSPDDAARTPHHLYGVADASETWSVGDWLRAVARTLEEIAARDRPVIVVGGTGLYFSALTEGLAEVPQVPAEVRREVRARLDRLGEEAFRQALSGVDPDAARRIAPGDRQRLARAMEVATTTGRALTAWQASTTPLLAQGAYRALVLDPPREVLYGRCDARLGAMAAHGGVEEVAALVARGLDPSLPAMKALGVREFARYLTGKLTHDQALELARQETRRYAKRQTTWFRNRTPHWPRTVEPDVDPILDEATRWTTAP